jgi:hypothetical protein
MAKGVPAKEHTDPALNQGDLSHRHGVKILLEGIFPTAISDGFWWRLEDLGVLISNEDDHRER